MVRQVLMIVSVAALSAVMPLTASALDQSSSPGYEVRSCSCSATGRCYIRRATGACEVDGDDPCTGTCEFVPVEVPQRGAPGRDMPRGGGSVPRIEE
jgi:hypothetical protein